MFKRTQINYFKLLKVQIIIIRVQINLRPHDWWSKLKESSILFITIFYYKKRMAPVVASANQETI